MNNDNQEEKFSINEILNVESNPSIDTIAKQLASMSSDAQTKFFGTFCTELKNICVDGTLGYNYQLYVIGKGLGSESKRMLKKIVEEIV